MSLQGQQLGSYRLLRLIGSGGMGEVYLAEDTSVNRQVAIKVVRTELTTYESSKEAMHLFQSEAKAIALLDHPGILPLYDYGEQSVNGAMLTYLVMPYREEGSLANWLQKVGVASLSLQGVEQIVQQAAAALHYAHDHQVVHQDVKPSNFLIRIRRDNPKRFDLLLADFGIAKLSMFISSTSLSIRGTPTYMAPEQWEGHPVPATDQYALAVMVYGLLTGRPPFQGSPMQLMYAHVNTLPLAPSLLNRHLSASIDAVILRGLAKRSEGRFPSILAFAFAFRQALRSVDPSIAVGISSPDLSRLVKATSTTGGGVSYGRLVINEEEARTGTSRTLRLPSGRQVRIRIPAGVREGQIVSVKDQSEASTGASAGRVHLTLSIARAATSPAPVASSEGAIAQGDSTAMTTGEKANKDRIFVRDDALIAANPDGSKPAGASPLAAGPATSEAGRMGDRGVLTVTDQFRTFQFREFQFRKLSGVILLAALVLLIVAGSAGLFYFAGGRHAAPGSEANLTATAEANVLHTATAQARNGATATARASATARVITPNSNPYPPYTGSLALNDQLNGDGSGHQWQMFNGGTTGVSCLFVNGTYHVIDALHSKGACYAAATDFSNFTYQVQMMFVRAGQNYDGGGLVIRSSGNNYYYFEIFESGRYEFNACAGNDCTHTLAQGLQGVPGFHVGLNQANTIAIVAGGNSFDLYVNDQHVAGPVSDSNSTSSHGMIGVYGEGSDATTEVAYSNAKVWA